MKLRKKVAIQIRTIRQEIQSRNALIGKSESGSTQTVKMGKDIRNGLKDVTRDVEVLEQLQKKEQENLEDRKLRKKKVKPEEEEEVKERASIVVLCKEHIEECKRFERSVRGTITGVYVDVPTDPTITTLPSIDGGQILLDQDAEIDSKVGQVSIAVARVKEMAVGLGQEIEMQGQMIGDLHEKVVKTTDQLESLNKRLKKTLAGVRKADRFCIDIIILVVILAIGGYIYNLFT